MTSISRFLKGITLTLLAFGAAYSASAQYLPICSGTGAGMVYFASRDSIYELNPASPATPFFTGVILPSAAGVPTAQALAVSKNLNGGTPSPTWYTTLSNGTSNIVHWWNGTFWVNTGHILNSDHIAGGGGYLYGLLPGSGLVFKYDGSTTKAINALPAIPSVTTGPQDLAADCEGNFYVLPSTTLSAPSTGTIGTATTVTGDTTYPSAFANKPPAYRMQIFYSAAELTAAGLSAGNITSMGFYINSLGSAGTNSNFTVKIGSFSSALVGLASLTPSSTLPTTVYGPSTYAHTASGLQTINFTTPFFWDGISPIVVELTYSSAHLINNAQTYYTATTGSTVVYDTTGNPAAAGIASTQRPNTTFGFVKFPKLLKYSSAGALLNSYALTGNYAGGAGGLAVNGNNVFYDGIDSKLYSGVINPANSTVNFSASTSTIFAKYPATDFGSCGYAGFDGNIGATDTFSSCNGAQNVTLTATGPGPYNWTVLSGPGTITGTGSTVTVNATNTTVITHNDANCAGVNSVVDTEVIFIANATLTMDPDRTIFSCGQPVYDSVRAHLTNITSGISYAFEWTALRGGAIVGGNTDSTLIFQITKTDTFVVSVKTISGCDFRDSVIVTIRDSTPHADFQYLYRYGCDEDTVCFFNTSYGGIDSFAWDFRDSAGNNGAYYYTDAIAPCHIFKDQGFYPVKLLAKNAYCQDTVTKLISASHPLLPDFAVDDTTGCSNHLFIFSDKSVVPGPPWPFPAVTYKYDFGDGTTSNLANPTHKFSKTGVYKVILTLTDRKLGCMASMSHTIVVDSVPTATIITADTVICQGQAVRLKASYLTEGNTGITFDMGDGSKFDNTDEITYSFVEPGTYNVVLTSRYRYCPDAVYSYPFQVRPFPGINIGPDTVLCPNGAPVVLSDRANLGNTAAKYLWSTGETTASIAARGIGTYWARVNIGSCTATDSVLINKDCYIDIPNSFTPNGDGNNDYYLPRQFLSRSVNTFKMSIFNRWGQVVFETTAINGRGWDGKFNNEDQPLGVYVYKIDVSFDNGTAEHYTGNLTLLR